MSLPRPYEAEAWRHTRAGDRPVDPGFGFAVLEEPERLLDRGVKETKGNKKTRALELIAALIQTYQPKLLVLEDYDGKGSRRCARVQNLIDGVSKLALEKGVLVKRFSRAAVKQAFAPDRARTKYEIAKAIAERFPELAPRLPRFRKPWMSEDYRMSIFDAMALAVTKIENTI